MRLLPERFRSSYSDSQDSVPSQIDKVLIKTYGSGEPYPYEMKTMSVFQPGNQNMQSNGLHDSGQGTEASLPDASPTDVY